MTYSQGSTVTHSLEGYSDVDNDSVSQRLQETASRATKLLDDHLSRLRAAQSSYQVWEPDESSWQNATWNPYAYPGLSHKIQTMPTASSGSHIHPSNKQHVQLKSTMEDHTSTAKILRASPPPEEPSVAVQRSVASSKWLERDTGYSNNQEKCGTDTQPHNYSDEDIPTIPITPSKDKRYDCPTEMPHLPLTPRQLGLEPSNNRRADSKPSSSGFSRRQRQGIRSKEKSSPLKRQLPVAETLQNGVSVVSTIAVTDSAVDKIDQKARGQANKRRRSIRDCMKIQEVLSLSTDTGTSEAGADILGYEPEGHAALASQNDETIEELKTPNHDIGVVTTTTEHDVTMNGEVASSCQDEGTAKPGSMPAQSSSNVKDHDSARDVMPPNLRFPILSEVTEGIESQSTAPFNDPCGSSTQTNEPGITDSSYQVAERNAMLQAQASKASALCLSLHEPSSSQNKVASPVHIEASITSDPNIASEETNPLNIASTEVAEMDNSEPSVNAESSIIEQLMLNNKMPGHDGVACDPVDKICSLRRSSPVDNTVGPKSPDATITSGPSKGVYASPISQSKSFSTRVSTSSPTKPKFSSPAPHNISPQPTDLSLTKTLKRRRRRKSKFGKAKKAHASIKDKPRKSPENHLLRHRRSPSSSPDPLAL